MSGIFSRKQYRLFTQFKVMARYLLAQYPNNKYANQRGDKMKGDDSKLKTRIVTRVALPVYALKILQQLKNSLLLAELYWVMC